MTYVVTGDMRSVVWLNGEILRQMGAYMENRWRPGINTGDEMHH